MKALGHDFRPGPVAATSAVEVMLLPPLGRFSLRANLAEQPALSAAIGTQLPQKIGARAAADGLEILCIGPDEWQILIAESQAASLVLACARISTQTPHSLTDISDREVSVSIAGLGAVELLSLGCPRDIGQIGEGGGRRTLIDGATVILWRDGPERFRVDVWRSFAPHLIELLSAGCAELAAEFPSYPVEQNGSGRTLRSEH